MTDVQKFYRLQAAMENNAGKVGLLDEMRQYITHNSWLSSFLRLAKEREWIIAEMNKLPQHMLA